MGDIGCSTGKLLCGIVKAAAKDGFSLRAIGVEIDKKRTKVSAKVRVRVRVTVRVRE